MEQGLSNINTVSLMNIVEYMPTIKDQVSLSLINKEVCRKMKKMPNMKRMEELANSEFVDGKTETALPFRKFYHIFCVLFITITALSWLVEGVCHFLATLIVQFTVLFIFSRKIKYNIAMIQSYIDRWNNFYDDGVINCFSTDPKFLIQFLCIYTSKLFFSEYLDNRYFNILYHIISHNFIFIDDIIFQIIFFKIIKYISKKTSHKFKRILINAINGENEIALYALERCVLGTIGKIIVLEEIIRHDNLKLFKVFQSRFDVPLCLDIYEKIYKYDSISVFKYLSNENKLDFKKSTWCLKLYQPAKIMST